MDRDIVREMKSAALGDARLTRRAAQVVKALAAQPGLSPPKAMQTDSALEAFYRLLRNPKVSLEALLEPHLANTATFLGQAHESVVVAHDTTEFSFPGDSLRTDLGELIGGRQGFHGHFALGLEMSKGSCQPVGALAFKPIFRKERKGKRTPAQTRRDPTCESKRWWQLVQECEERLQSAGASAVHVMDREADDFTLFQNLMGNGYRFVIRAAHDRRINGPDGPIQTSDLYSTSSTEVTREVCLSARKNSGDKAKHHPTRNARVARLRIIGHRVHLLRSKHLTRDVASCIECHFVQVTELGCPEEESPVSWKLWTTEAIETAADLEQVIDLYRSRWCIEEFFKALKTGCTYERRQLESRFTLLNALGLYIPVACNILRLKTLGRGPLQDLPAVAILPASSLQALGAATQRVLTPSSTVRDVVLAIARLGGHIRNNGEPGWQVLWRGYQDFLVFQAGWDAAQAQGKM